MVEFPEQNLFQRESVLEVLEESGFRGGAEGPWWSCSSVLVPKLAEHFYLDHHLSGFYSDFMSETLVGIMIY